MEESLVRFSLSLSTLPLSLLVPCSIGTLRQHVPSGTKKMYLFTPDTMNRHVIASFLLLLFVYKKDNGCVNLQANFARWEPRHGRFQFHHPWKQYLKIGALVRQCAYRIEALNGYLNSDLQVTIRIMLDNSVHLHSIVA